MQWSPSLPMGAALGGVEDEELNAGGWGGVRMFCILNVLYSL